MGAPTFKEQIAADISTTFLNCLEFADTHTVNGKEMAAVVDDNELLERDKAKIMAAQTEGTYKARRLVYVAKADFGPRPAQGAMLTLDGKAYKVKSCTEEAGVLAIELEAVRSCAICLFGLTPKKRLPILRRGWVCCTKRPRTLCGNP